MTCINSNTSIDDAVFMICDKCNLTFITCYKCSKKGHYESNFLKAPIITAATFYTINNEEDF